MSVTLTSAPNVPESVNDGEIVSVALPRASSWTSVANDGSELVNASRSASTSVALIETTSVSPSSRF